MTRGVIKISFCVAGLGASLAFAAEPKSSSKYQAARREESELTADFRKTAKLTLPEMEGQSDKYMERITAIRNRVADLNKLALKKSDVTKSNCVRDRSQKINGHYVIAKQAREDLARATSASDVGEGQQQFTRITILHEKVVVLGTEAEGCVGEDVSYVGATRVDVEIDPSVPREDPTAVGLPIPDVSRPAEQSITE